MDYAIGFCFDKSSEDRFTDIMNAIAKSGVNKYMIDTKIPPHVTVSLFSTDNIDPIITELGSYCAGQKSGNIYWDSLGAFTPHILFAAPVLNEYLMNACISTNKLVEKFALFGDNGHYLPYKWVPHTALAVKMNQEELKIAFETALQYFSAFGGIVNRLFLAECNPYKELRVWELLAI